MRQMLPISTMHGQQAAVTGTQSRKGPKVYRKSRYSTKHTEQLPKKENHDAAYSEELKRLEEQGIRAINALNELNTFCDLHIPNETVSPPSPTSFHTTAKEDKPSLTSGVGDGIKDIQLKNKRIRAILDEMTSDRANTECLGCVEQLQNVFKHE